MGTEDGQTGNQDTGDQDTGDTGTGDDKPWYDGASEESIPTLEKYKTQGDFISAHMSLQSKLGNQDKMISPVDSEAEPEIQREQLRLARIKLGAKENPEDYQINLPPEVLSQVPEEFITAARANAHRAGLTQAEVDAQVTEAAQLFMEEQQTLADVEATMAQERDTIRADMERELETHWGGRKSALLKATDDMADYYDRVLFRQENEKIPGEERSEKGGIMRQIMRKLDGMKLDGVPYSAGAAMRRAMAMNHDRILGEGVMHQGLQQGEKVSTFQKHYDQAKVDYPQRGERYWKELATARAKRERAGG